MANPVLSEKIFRGANATSNSQTMTINGTLTKTLLLVLMVAVAAAYSWKVFYTSVDPMGSTFITLMLGGVIVAFILAMIIAFKPNLAQYLSPVYAVGEGLAIGGISAMVNLQFAEKAPNIVINAVALTLITAIIMLVIYRFRIIKVNAKFHRIIYVALISILVFYITTMLLGFFGIDVRALTNNSPLAIGINVIIAGVAAFSLLTDYDFIEKASYNGAPKYMEWYGAFGLVVTLVWLYLEILKLLSKVNSRN